MNKRAVDFSPLLKSVIARTNFPVLSADEVEDFLKTHNKSLLFVSGDWERLAESDDVAAILPELRTLGSGLAIAVIARDAERALQLRFRFNKFPALVLCRGTGYLGAVTGMRDWVEFGAEISALLKGPVRDPPPFKFPEGCMANGASIEPGINRDLLINQGSDS